MAWLISDANIIIDLEAGEILDLMFRLPERFIVPDVLYLEELAEHHPHLPGLGLEILSLNENFVAEAYRMGGTYRRPGHNDLLALALAKQEQCPLLTGDSGLRDAAEQEAMEVMGTLWLMERMFEQKLLSFSELEEAYEKMRQEERWLPTKEINRQLRRLRQSDK